jgi:riboflavin synthase
MFTGLVETVGRLERLVRSGPDASLEVAVRWPEAGSGAGVAIGDSVALNGACLTVVQARAAGDGARVVFEASHETLDRTTVGSLGPGALCHLERALRVGDRVGGHLVSGHVDGVGALTRTVTRGRARDLEIALPAELEPEVVPRGSIAVDGVSLTVTRVWPGHFAVTLIPHTAEKTQLLAGQPGKRVNLETDLLAKYVRRALATGSRGNGAGHAGAAGRFAG